MLEGLSQKTEQATRKLDGEFVMHALSVYGLGSIAHHVGAPGSLAFGAVTMLIGVLTAGWIQERSTLTADFDSEKRKGHLWALR